MTAVVDSSVLLAILLNEAQDETLLMRIIGCHISTVNLIELLTRAVDKGVSCDDALGLVDRLRVENHALDRLQAIEAARLRVSTRQLGLSLGDRACLALARRLKMPVLTADRAWAALDIGIDIQLIR